MNIISVCVGFILDLIFGDPYSLPHPIKYIGRYIAYWEKVVRHVSVNERGLKIGGFVMWAAVVSTTFIVTGTVLSIAGEINQYLYYIVNAILIYTTLATKCLKDEAVKIYDVLKVNDIKTSRKYLSYIVGRDTQNLSKPEITRAVIETVAENTVDGIIAPMFYAFIGGAPLAMAYKAVNTLDSMVGYKNEKYKDIGFASAKLDDLFNFIPARLSLVFISIGAMLLGLDYKNAFKIGFRDRKNHKSPNCAYSEGAVAGALSIQLGGTNVYFGQVVEKPTIGDQIKEVNEEHIVMTNKIMYASSASALVLFAAVFYMIGIYV